MDDGRLPARHSNDIKSQSISESSDFRDGDLYPGMSAKESFCTSVEKHGIGESGESTLYSFTDAVDSGDDGLNSVKNA